MSVTLAPHGPRAGDIARLIDAEFDEMPGMRLTRAQVRRLWNLTDLECGQVLDHLCESGFLTCDQAGRFFRREFDY